MTTTDPRQPWDRRPDESPPAFAAFRTYLEQGAARSVTKVAEECHKSRSLIGRWSSRHRWRARSDAYDAHDTARYLAEVADARRTLAHRHLAVSRVALAKVAAAVEGIDVDGLTVPELTRLSDIATRTEREALQVPVRLEVTGADGGPVPVLIAEMTDEERLARLQVLRREIDERITDRNNAEPDDSQPATDDEDHE
jgi:hypothetical protein